MAHKPVTSYDVAQLAGVSQPTVSRAFAPEGTISPATRARVLDAARRLGYQPNAIARGLTTQRTDIVAIVMGNISRSLFYPRVLDILTHRLQAMGKQVLLFNAHETRSADEILPRIMSYRVDALIVAHTTPGRELIDRYTSAGAQVVLLNRTVPDTKANAVCSDNVAGGRMVADLFLDAGHRRPGFLAGIGVTATNLLRQKGFVDRLAERGHGNVLIEQGAYSFQTGFDAALRLLDRDDPPDAIFCAADIMALGAMDAARSRLGIKVPDEVSIVGYDDIPMAGWPAYDLTTVRQPVPEMLDKLIELLSQQNAEALTGQVYLMPVDVVRRSSARLPENQ
jgi:DNA-binding LacI/PurR family transcriptional regulator